MLLAEAIMETEATLDDCVTALRDLGLLPSGGVEGVKTVNGGQKPFRIWRRDAGDMSRLPGLMATRM